MSILNTSITYPLLLISSMTKRSFEALGRIAKTTGTKIKRMLRSYVISLDLSHKIAQHIFKDHHELTLAVDDTLIKKIYSNDMVGSGRFFDTKIGRSINAYRLIVGAITDGRHIIPIDFGFMFTKEVLEKHDTIKSKLDYVKIFFKLAQELFPNVKIKIAADGLFASIEFLSWCAQNNISATVRMHSNRKVEFNGKSCKISEITCLTPKGRQMARTIKVIWHGLFLHLTAERRISKNGKESIVFIAATYFAKPIQYVKNYKKRWPIEKCFRTSKQYLGLQECFSTKLETQQDHVAAVFLSYSIAQLIQKSKKLDNPEEAIQDLKLKNSDFWIDRFTQLTEIFGGIYS